MLEKSKLPFTPYSTFLSRYFQEKVWKLPVDLGAGCPVRDGSIAHGGCSFCNGRSFVPASADLVLPPSVQLERGKQFVQRKLNRHSPTTFLAYFQNGTNTYVPLRDLQEAVENALNVANISGIVLSTRPDCLPVETLNYLERLASKTFVSVELGLESVHPLALQLAGRGHSVETSRQAVHALAERDIPVTAHFILGLPGETRETMLLQTDFLNEEPIAVVKLHHLQIVSGSRLAVSYLRAPEQFTLWTAEAYIEFLADYLSRLRPDLAVERLVAESPASQLIAPRWGIKPDEFMRALTAYMKQNGRSQGSDLPARQ